MKRCDTCVFFKAIAPVYEETEQTVCCWTQEAAVPEWMLGKNPREVAPDDGKFCVVYKKAPSRKRLAA